MTTKEEQYRQALEKIRATLLGALRINEPGVDTSTPALAENVAWRMNQMEGISDDRR